MMIIMSLIKIAHGKSLALKKFNLKFSFLLLVHNFIQINIIFHETEVIWIFLTYYCTNFIYDQKNLNFIHILFTYDCNNKAQHTQK